MERTNNRAEILQAALSLFALRGYDATGVKEIVDAVGVAKPTLYHYFGSKRGLLDGLVAERSEGFLLDLAAAARYEHNLPATLNQVVDTYLTFARTQPLFARFLLSLLFVAPENEACVPAARVLGEQQRLLEEMFERASHDHGNMRRRQQRYARALLGVLNGYILLVANGQLEVTDTLRREIVQQFSHGIYS